MKTSRTRAAGQQTGRKAPARSTSALATETRAKALPRRLAAIAGDDPTTVEALVSGECGALFRVGVLPKARAQRVRDLPTFLGQLAQLAADFEATATNREGLLVASVVRHLAALALAATEPRAPGRLSPILAPTTDPRAVGLQWVQEGEQIEAAPSSQAPDSTPAPSPAHLEISEATLEALTYLSDAQEAARRLALALGQHIEPRDLPDLRDDAQDLALCLDQLGGELGRCCYQLTGLGGPGPRSLAVNVRDLAAVVAGLRARLRPDQAAEETSAHGAVARIAAQHFARSA